MTQVRCDVEPLAQLCIENVCLIIHYSVCKSHTECVRALTDCNNCHNCNLYTTYYVAFFTITVYLIP